MSSHSPYRKRSDAVSVTVSLCLCYSTIFFLVGLYLRLRSRSYKWDDAIAAVAAVSNEARSLSTY
jgi:hypothetical protein